MTFSERFQSALAFKSLDVEEFIDVRFHRPIAAAFTALISKTGISPNQITLMSLLTGWTGAFFLFQAFFNPTLLGPAAWLLSAFFLFSAVILDCADGQLARARGGGTRLGRLLDGFVDVLVLLPTYFILGFGIKETFGPMWFSVTVVAGLSTWIRCAVYDKIKNVYLAHTMPNAGGGEGTETVEEVKLDRDEARQSGSTFAVFLLSIYIVYLNIQQRFAPGSTEQRSTARQPDQMEEFRNIHRPTMRVASWLGLGTHMFFIYSSIAIAAFFPPALLALQVIFATVFNIALAVVLVRSRSFHTV